MQVRMYSPKMSSFENSISTSHNRSCNPIKTSKLKLIRGQSRFIATVLLELSPKIKGIFYVDLEAFVMSTGVGKKSYF